MSIVPETLAPLEGEVMMTVGGMVPVSVHPTTGYTVTCALEGVLVPPGPVQVIV